MRTESRAKQVSAAKGQEGQAVLVEFMFSTIFLMLLIFSTFELFGLLYTYNVMADAAKEGVRYAVVHGVNNSNSSGPSTQQTKSTPPCTSSNNNNSTAANVITRVQQFAGLSLHDTSNMNVYVCYLDGNNLLTSQVEVAINYPFRPFFHMSWPSLTINANSAGRIVF